MENKTIKVGGKYRVKETFVLDLETDGDDIIFDGLEIREGEVFTLDELVGCHGSFVARVVLSNSEKWVRITEETFYRYFEEV